VVLVTQHPSDNGFQRDLAIKVPMWESINFK